MELGLSPRNEVVYETLMKASSNPGDLVIDFMAGSGTCGGAAAFRRPPG